MVDSQSRAPSPDPPRRLLAESIEAYTGAGAFVAAATLVGLWVAQRWGTAAVDMLYLPAVLAAAALWGRGPGVATGLLAALAYNYFFTAPVHSFRIDRPTDVVTVIVLVVAALVTGRLAAAMRAQARIAAAHAARNATIAGFARRLLSCGGEEDIAHAACAELAQLFGCNVTLVGGLPQPLPIASAPQGNRLTPADVAAAALTVETGAPAGRGTSRTPPAEWAFYPIRSDGEVLAAAGLARDDGRPAVDAAQLLLLTNLLDQVALALERARLERQARAFAAVRERDMVRSVLLASIGNDLKPGLAAIVEAAREQRRKGTGDRQFVAAVESEAAGLRRYVENLIDLGPAPDQQLVQAGDVRIDLFRRKVWRAGHEVHLTPKEYAVLAELAKHPGQVLTHAQLLRTAWGPAQESQPEYLRVAVRALRRKLEREPSRPELIFNEPAVGYRLAV
jgi:two-component system sensor histidine kinase KdpD